MDIHFLHRDELLFELACRNVHISSSVVILKKVLKELLVSESKGINKYELKAPIQTIENPKNELDLCTHKIQMLKSIISELDCKPDKVYFRRLFSRLLHIKNRLSFIVADSSSLITLKDDLVQQVESQLNNLEIKDDLVETEVLTLVDKTRLEETLGELGKSIINKLENNELEEGCNSKLPEPKIHMMPLRDEVFHDNIIAHRSEKRLARSSTINYGDDIIQKSKNKLVPISQWGVRFSADGNFSVHAFLERIDELKDARNATDDDLWRYAIDLFEGDALIWFRANRSFIKSWDELKAILKRTFQNPYYQEELMDTIKKRTQGCKESVTIFISIMQNMFNRLPTKIAEYSKVNLVKRNLLPYYQQAICRDEFESLAELVNVLRIIERTKINCDNFQEPVSSNANLEPDLAYKNTGYRVDEIKVNSATVKSEQRCWNCREQGHMFRECTLPKQRLFCYKCGKFGVTINNCCKNLGNEKREEL